MTDLPYVDEHEVVVRAPRDRVWAVLVSYVDGVLASGRPSAAARLLATSPVSGFEVAHRAPEERVELVGRHRFSQYRLVFSLHDTHDGATAVRATTYAAFPGAHGAAYRLLVIRSRLHVVATRWMLDALRRRAEAG